jgi:GntR family transcriptional repressor for pyruvate dehydrogenase complex
MNSNQPEIVLEEVEPLARTPMSERVAWKILELVRSGNLRAGDRLPTENEFANAMRVSRPVIREALRGLSILGVVESRQGGRCYITDLSPARLIAPVQLVLPIKDENLDQLHEARALVEGELVALAAQRASDEDIKRLGELAVSGLDLVDDPIAFRLHDFEFHSLIISAAGNPYLERVTQSFYNLGMDHRRTATEKPGVAKRSVEQHRAIVDALRRRDPQGAAAAMRDHLLSITKTTREAMQKDKHNRGG